VFFVLSAGVEVKIAIRKERCFENVFAEYDFRGMDQVVIGFMTKVVNG
jgi:putative heme iron utilization protein